MWQKFFADGQTDEHFPSESGYNYIKDLDLTDLYMALEEDPPRNSGVLWAFLMAGWHDMDSLEWRGGAPSLWLMGAVSISTLCSTGTGSGFLWAGIKLSHRTYNSSISRYT